MEDIFNQALAERTKKEAGLIDLLPGVKTQVQELLTTEVQDGEVIADSQLA